MKLVGVLVIAALIGLGIFYLISRVRLKEPDAELPPPVQPPKGKRK